MNSYIVCENFTYFERGWKNTAKWAILFLWTILQSIIGNTVDTTKINCISVKYNKHWHSLVKMNFQSCSVLLLSDVLFNHFQEAQFEIWISNVGVYSEMWIFIRGFILIITNIPVNGEVRIEATNMDESILPKVIMNTWSMWHWH